MSNKVPIHNRRMLLVLAGIALLFFVGAVSSFVRRLSPHPPAAKASTPRATSATGNSRTSLPPAQPQPQSITQFDLSHNVVAGGGGTSSNGSFRLDGTIGQQTAGTTSSAGPYSMTNGFWQPETGGTATPTPTPTATPTPTPPTGPTILVEDGANLIAAVDSVTFVRGPFRLTDDFNFSSDHRTRIIFFTTTLGFSQSTQPDTSTLSVQVGGFNLSVETAGPISIGGVDSSYIVLRLPDLPTGDWPVTIQARGVNSTNSPILRIAGP